MDVGAIHEVIPHGEPSRHCIHGCAGDAFHLLGQPLQRGLKLHDKARHALGHAVESVGSGAMLSVQETITHAQEVLNDFTASACKGFH